MGASPPGSCQSEGGWQVFGASDIPYPGRHQPMALDASQIRDLRGSFRCGRAPRRHALGIDFAEVHGAHGYLIHNFLSPLTNQRTDAYGGSLENRMRFALEVFEAVREEWPADKPVGMRLSATDWVDGGWTVDDSVVNWPSELKTTRVRLHHCVEWGQRARTEDHHRTELPGAVRTTDSRGSRHPNSSRWA
jgi:2,4-dienoyl-CoA reductase-like NADH-dependent reductase (Old Yellow Enzyme family)